jgi:hypothetical protein
MMSEVCHGPQEFANPGTSFHRQYGGERNRPGRQFPVPAPCSGIPILPATRFARLSHSVRRAARPGQCPARHSPVGRAGRSARMLGESQLPYPREKFARGHPIRMVPAPGTKHGYVPRLYPGPKTQAVIRDSRQAGLVSFYRLWKSWKKAHFMGPIPQEPAGGQKTDVVAQKTLGPRLAMAPLWRRIWGSGHDSGPPLPALGADIQVGIRETLR